MLQTSTDVIICKSHNNLRDEALLILFYKEFQKLGNYPI